MADEALSAGAVAQRLGVAVTTLRTWHQRYGLGPSQHIPGHHRRYTPADLARLEVMRRLTAEGVSPAEAARWARQAPDALAAVGASRAVLRRRDGGGTTIPVGPARPAAIGATISRAIAADGVVTTWDRLLRPLLVGLGERHAATGDVIEVEHLVSRCVSAALGAVASAGPASGPPRVLLACADEEQHSLALEALAAALAEAGVGYRMLGARVPVTALLGATRRTRPSSPPCSPRRAGRCSCSPDRGGRPHRRRARLARPSGRLLTARSGSLGRLGPRPGRTEGTRVLTRRRPTSTG